MEEMEEPRGRERIGERVYDKDENRRNARLGFVDFVPRGENNDACVRVSEGPLRLRRRVRGRVSATREAQGRVSPPNRLELCHAVVVRARASRFRGPPPRPHANGETPFWEKKQTLGTHGTRVRRCSSVPGASRPDVDARQGLYPFRTAPRLSADARAAVWVTARPPPGLSSRRDVSRQKPTH